MINVICAKTLRVFKEDQKKLLGVSLLCVLMSAVIMILSGAVPIIGISIVLVILAGMRTIFFAAYQKKKISSDMLFLGFNDLKHVCGGMLWMFFKVTVWLLIPVVGIFFAILKAYEYRFVPYILITRPEIRGIDATEVSSRETDGFKSNMFYADAIIIGTVAVSGLILYALSLIPAIGVVFAAILAVLTVSAVFCLPFIRGLVGAAFYYEIYHKTIMPAKHSVICPCCLSKTDGNGQFCSKCGERLVQIGKNA